MFRMFRGCGGKINSTNLHYFPEVLCYMYSSFGKKFLPKVLVVVKDNLKPGSLMGDLR